MGYQFAHFNALMPWDIEPHFPFLTKEQVNASWLEWLEDYVRRAHLCYRSQLYWHYDAIWQPFARKHNLPMDESLSEYDYPQLHAELQRELHEDGYYLHEQAHENEIARLEVLERNYNPSGKVRIIEGFSEAIEYYRSIHERRFHPRYMVEYIDRLWFDRAIYNDEAEIKRLRCLPYAEYLKTSHWTRVKQAMRLIHSTQCQGDQCAGCDSYWQDEAHIHVHHLHYKNKGMERYDDLRLLCDRCHKLIHERGTDFVLSKPARPYIRLPYWIQPYEG